MLARLLVPTDFSSSSERALSAAADLAEALGAELSVLHVGRGGAAARLGAFADRWADGRATTLVERRAPDPAAEIVEAAAGADLVVLSPRGATGRRTGLGKVAGEVARRAGVPVLLLSPDGTRLPQGLRVLVAVDLGEASAAALRAARAVAAALGGSVEVLHAVPDTTMATGWGGEAIADDDPEEQFARVERFVDRVGGAEVPVTVGLGEGSPEAAISAAVRAADPALVVAGRSGSSVDRLLAAVGSLPTLHVPA